MHVWDVITHGGGEGLVYVFNAVAAFFNGQNKSSGLAAALLYVSGAFGTVIAAYIMVTKQELKMTFSWFFWSFLLVNCVMIPKTNIKVIDRITGFEAPVANVPFVLGAFAGIASQLGDIVTKKMDDIFSGPISNLKDPLQGGEVMEYRRHGVAMASQLLAKASRFTITDPDMAANVREFVQQCMIYDIAKGKYSIQELLSCGDVWGLLKENASASRGFPYRTLSNGGAEHHIVTCADGAEKLELDWTLAIEHAKKIYGSRFFPHSKNAANLLASNLGISYQYLTQLSLQASEILRQNMMINAIEDGLLSYNQTTDASAAITGYALTRAQEQQKTAYALEGKMASLALSVLKIVIEVVFYGIFPIIIVIAILPGGAAVLKKYIIALFWIQSWGPLYSILNMLVNTFGKIKSMAAVTAYTGTALSAATLPGLCDANEWVAAVAGYAMMSVPFLSYGLIHYGAGALSQLSTHFGSITQSAANHAAEEATTGNYNMGNTNFDNHNRHNIAGFKHDTNSLVSTGRSTIQMLDGSMMSNTGMGEAIFDRSSAISRIGGNMNFSESISNSFSEMAERSEQYALTEMESAQKNLTSASQEMHDYRHNRSLGTSLDNAVSHGESALTQSAFSTYVDKVDNFAKENRISFDKANVVLAKAALDLKGGIGSKALRLEGDVGVAVQGSRSDSTSEMMNKARIYTQKEGLSDLIQKSFTDNIDKRFNQNDSESDSYAKGISTQLSEAESHLDSASVSYTESQHLRDAAQHVNSQGVAFNQDLSQCYVNWLSGQTQDGAVLGIQGVNHVLADPDINQRYMTQFVKEEGTVLYQQWEQQTIKLDDSKIKLENNVNRNFEQSTKNISQKVEQLGLNKNVNSNLPHNTDIRMKEIDLEIQRRCLDLKENHAQNNRKID